MKSLAVTLSGFLPRTTTFTVSGTVSRTSFVIQELKIAVVPTPNATQPTAPAWGVCESEPMITIPGSACPSRILERQLAVQLDPLLLGERALLLFELERDIEQPLLDALGRHGFRKEGEVIAKHEDRAGIGHPLPVAHELLEEDRRHRGHVLVAEPDVGDHEPFIARLDGRHADLAPRRVDHPVARDDLFAERHRPARRRGRREHDLALEPGHVEVEQSSVLDDATRDLALTLGEGGERDRLAAADPVDDREVGGRENAQVLAVLPIDPLDVLGHHQLDAGAHLGVGGLLTRRALATPLAADRGDEAAALYRPPRDRELLAALQAQVGEVAEGFVVVVADIGA